MYSKTVLVGNLARDPESRQAGETTVTRLVVAINDAYSKDKVSYVDVEAWGKLGEICQKYLTKGRQALVDGRLVQDVWVKDGQKQSKLYVKADNVQFLGGKGDNQKDAPQSSTPSIPSTPSAPASQSGSDEDIPF
jgi:single-strand DNA-binding protein